MVNRLLKIEKQRTAVDCNKKVAFKLFMPKKIIPVIILLAHCFVACHSQPVTKNSKETTQPVYTFHKASADGIGKFYMQREIAHVMGAEGAGWLERDERQQEENTNLAIEKMKLATNSVIADIGAGTGYYSFKLATKVPKGRVYAVELQDELIRFLQNKKALSRDSVVEIIKSAERSPNLPDNSIDLAIMVDVYHELEFPHEMLQAIKKSLKNDGMILLIEYRAEDPSIPIKALHKTSVAQLNKELNANGFQLYYDGEFLPIQHFLLYKKRH
jgi:ubiquinone/menaquinone biosynthesis C-methylase UbiE